MLEVHLAHVAVAPAEERAHREAGNRATSSEEEAERRIWQSVQNEVLAAANPVEVTRRERPRPAGVGCTADCVACS